MARTAQISKEKQQSIIILRHGQSIWKISSFQVSSVQSRKPSSIMLKLALMRTATGKEDPSAAENKFIRVYQPQKLQPK
jgi:hypothetical protein